MALIKKLPKSALFQETLPDGSELYVSFRTAYVVKKTGVGEIITSMHINR